MPDEPSGQHEPGPTTIEDAAEDAAGESAAVESAAVTSTEPNPPAPNPSVAPTKPITAAPIAAPADPGFTSSGIPTFEAVREKIETRYGASLGSAELDAQTPEGRSVEEQYAAREKAAAERLEQIRASMHSDTPDH